MGAQAPGLASPLRSIQKPPSQSAVSAPRCRSQPRTVLRQQYSSSIPLTAASAVLTRSSPSHPSGRGGCRDAVVAASSAAASFDASADELDSLPSIAAADAIETGEAHGNATFTQAVLNVINIVTGVGLLSVPFALRRAGWAGLGILWLMGFVMNYTGKALGECHKVVTKKRQREGSNGTALVGYEDIGAEAFGAPGRAVVATSMYIELMGTCALLFILEGDNLFQLLGPRFAPNSATYMLLAAMVMIPTVWLPDLKTLSGLGMVGVAATLTVTAAVAYTLISGSFPVGAVTSAANWTSMPLVFGILAFVYSGHGVFPSVRASMQQPEDFPKVLNVAYATVAGLCTFIGATGYYMYGTAAKDLITFNLPAGLLATLCASVILVNPIAKLAITMDPVGVAANTWAASAIQGVPAGVRRFVVRTLLACACLAAARYVPFLAYFMSLIGSFLTIAVSVVLPISLHLKIFQGKLSKQRLAWNWLVIAIGVACALSGTTASVKALLASTASA